HLGIASVSRFLNSEISIKAHRIQESNASHALMRISQLDEDEYASQAEYATWAYSACSTASITEVLNAYGYRYRISDVLQVESRLGEITPQLGLVENVGIAHTAAQFGFRTTWGNHWTLAQVISMANLGRPVIVGWPPQRYEGGHIVVVTGGDAASIYLADSSRWNRRVLSHAQFLHWWAGFAAVLTPA
ncbi:MAG TPA: C39 family peptidase, partial [Ktedonobacteraceae bacterium]